MTAMQIQGKEYVINKVFSNDFEFSIPVFQRPYAWQAEHALDLYEDLFEAANASLDREADKAPLYFLGSIVTIKEDTSQFAKVVDGQQRLTTLSLLISILRHAISDKEKGSYLTQFLSADPNPLRNMRGRPRLAVREDTQDFYREVFIDVGGVDRFLRKETNAPRSTSGHNLAKNATALLERVEKASQNQLERLAIFLLERCVLVVVSSPDLDSAFRIFSVLNDRGLNLSSADILKAEVLQGIPDGEKDSAARRWEQLEDSLGTQAFDDLFSQIRMIYKKQIVSNITSEYRKDILPQFKSAEFLTNVLEPYGRFMEIIRSGQFEGGKLSDDINRIFRFLTMIDNSDWIAPALVAMKSHQGDPAALLRHLLHLERVAAFMLVTRTSRVPRIKRYGEILGQMQTDPAALPSASDLSSEEKEYFKSQLGGDLYLLNNVPKYVLLRLESDLSDNSAMWASSVISIEHVLPQNPPATSEWAKNFSEEERDELTHCLGNLAILSKKKNSSARAFDFQKKIKSYFGNCGGDSFAWTNGLREFKEWTPEVIRSRNREGLRRLSAVWDLG
jgi:hypothetical protein